MRVFSPDLHRLDGQGSRAAPPPLRSRVIPFNHTDMDHPIYGIPRSPPQHHRGALHPWNPHRAAPRAPRRPVRRHGSPHSPRLLQDELARLTIDHSDHSDSDFERAPPHHRHSYERRVDHHRRGVAPALSAEDVRLRTLVHPGRPSMSSSEIYLLPTVDYHLPVTVTGNSERPMRLRAVIPGCFTSNDLLRALGLRGVTLAGPLIEDGYHVLLIMMNGHSMEMGPAQRMDFLVQTLQHDRPVEVIVQPRGGRNGFLG